MRSKTPSDQERRAIERLSRLIDGASGLLRGTISERQRTCGKKSCKCVRGEKHSSIYLVVSVNGSYRQIYIPRAQEAEVRSWVENYRRIQSALEEISISCLDRLKD